MTMWMTSSSAVQVANWFGPDCRIGEAVSDSAEPGCEPLEPLVICVPVGDRWQFGPQVEMEVGIRVGVCEELGAVPQSSGELRGDG